MDNEKSNKRLALVLSVAFVCLLIGICLAYYVVKISNDKDENNIKFFGSKEFSFEDIPIKWNESKTFSLKNTTDKKHKYSIIWEEIKNTDNKDNELTMDITSTNNGGFGKDITLPNTGKNITIIENVEIQPGITQEYTFIFKYNALKDHENKKSFSGKIKVKNIK